MHQKIQSENMGKIQSLEIENTIGKNVSELEKLCY